MRRREFLKIGFAALPSVLPMQVDAAVSFRASSAIKKHGLESLETYLDTLLPGDGIPGASELDLHVYLVEHAMGVQNYLRLLSMGCYWLNAQSLPGSNFTLLDEVARVRLISLMENAAPGSIERQFFERTLSDAMQLYYAHPQTWPALGFDGPPQPVGFPDYRQPPA